MRTRGGSPIACGGDLEGVSVYEPNPSGAGGVTAGPAPEPTGTPMRVLALEPRGGTRARCAGADGIPQTVETALLAGLLEPGAIVLVQDGIALARLDAEWAP